jgi:hypothetical protein
VKGRLASLWEAIERRYPPPTRVGVVHTARWDYFQAAMLHGDRGFELDVVRTLSGGDVLLLKGVFSPEFMGELRAKTVAWTRSQPSSFHQMREGAPDFHRIIDLETGRKYSINGCKHSAYFYRWNDDPLGIWPYITERWRVAKIVMGLRPDEYETWTPKDGVVDRIQVVRYPPAIGYLEPHVDAWQHQRCFFSAYMSKRGVDFKGGGFYFVDASGAARYLEDQIDVGDVCLGHANLLHGVAPCDRDKTPDWNATDGRWFLSMYSNASDEVAKRHTAAPVKVAVEGVLP